MAFKHNLTCVLHMHQHMYLLVHGNACAEMPAASDHPNIHMQHTPLCQGINPKTQSVTVLDGPPPLGLQSHLQLDELLHALLDDPCRARVTLCELVEGCCAVLRALQVHLVRLAADMHE